MIRIETGRARRRAATVLAAAVGASMLGLGTPASTTPAVGAPAVGAPAVGAPAVGAPASGASVSDAAAEPFSGDPEVLSVPVAPESDGRPVTLDVAIYAPRTEGRPPAVILAHGFGGSRADLDGAARDLAGRGYLALTHSARGFGASGGRIHLQDPEVEGADVSRLIDLLASRDDVQLDAPGDPRVGMTGGSYGGAATLIAGGRDPRLDALAAAITWNDLADAFFPDFGTARAPTGELAPGGGAGSDGATGAGPFKRRWASHFFSSALAAGAPGQAAPGTCGRFEPTICALFLEAARTGAPAPALVSELHRRSPALTNAKISAPTLLQQGMRDSLFPLDQADANARQIAGAGTPVAVQWFDGGHDGGGPQATSSGSGIEDAGSDPASAYIAWFDTYLRGTESSAARRARPMPVPGFAYTAAAYARGARQRTISAPLYPWLRPGAPAPASIELPFADPTQRSTLLSPPGGDPAATTSIPGSDPAAGAADGLSAAAYRLAALPGQSVAFDTTAVPTATTVVGAPRVRLTVTSTTTDATLFLSWWKVTTGNVTSPRRQVVPVRVPTRPGVPATIEVALPAGTYALDQGTIWRVLVSATDAAYATPTDARVYTVQLAGDPLRLPILPYATEPPPARDGETVGLLVALAFLAIALVATGITVVVRRRRGDIAHARADLTGVPLSVSGLTKTFADGHRAVDDVSWRAERGQVVGLLGPNGAGKTTTIRMILGLIRPDAGEIHVHGALVHPGSPALAGIGALVEGPGFLPHLSGLANLHAYWAATGRPRQEARFDEALEVAALGDAVERPVKAYSQGMRQRLGIAQAMLGMPEVLLLDEPTNGLDPPQIAAMRPILRRYAQTGRTVVVSSHLLAEVEMTCSHVVVMHRGRVVLAGSVADLVDSADTTVVELVGDLAEADRVAARLRGDRAGTSGASGASGRSGTSGTSGTAGRWRRRPGRGVGLRGLVEVHAEMVDGTARLIVHATGSRAEVAQAVLAAGGDILALSGRRHLEEVFLGVIAADDLDAARKVRPR